VKVKKTKSHLPIQKTSQSITPLRAITKNCQWADVICTESFMQFPESEGWRKRLIFTLFAWLENSDSLFIEDFCYEYKIPRRTLTFWKNKYEDIRNALEDVKIFIGARRRKGAMTFKLHYASAYRDMQCYDPEWKENVDEYHAQLKANADRAVNAPAGNVQYILEKVIEYRDRPKEE
jgi:hypothetical protein